MSLRYTAGNTICEQHATPHQGKPQVAAIFALGCHPSGKNIRTIVNNIPLSRFIGNDDNLNLPSKQENDIFSREQLLAEQHTDPDIIQ